MDDDKTKVTTTAAAKPTRSLPADLDKIRSFIRALLDGKSASEAADEAGYDHRAIRGLLRRREVLNAIRDENAARDKIVSHTPAKVQSRLGALAFSDIGNLFTEDLKLKPLHTVDPDTRAAIVALEVREFVDPDTGQVSRRLYKAQLERKQPALQTLCEITNLTSPDGSVHYSAPGFQINIHLGPQSVAIGQERNARAWQAKPVDVEATPAAAIETTSALPPSDEPRN